MTASRPVLTLVLFLLALVLGQAAHAQISQEEVKATFLYRFVSFVSWPQDAFADAAAPVELCVIGADPMARTLQRTTADHRSGGRAFRVRRIADPDQLRGCHALYVVGDRTDAALRAARRLHVLSITDSVSGSDRGIIHFAVVDNRVRFYIDDALAEECGLSIDPQLLNLALAVRRRPAA